MTGEKKHRGKKTFAAKRTRNILLIILGLLIIIRILLPFVVLHYANKTLAAMPGYYGHVEDIDIALIRGAYVLNNLYINKIDTASQLQTPFFRSEVVDLSIEWKALLHGSLVGELEFERPTLRFTKDKAELDQVKKDTTDFRILLDKFMPLRINRFEINHGILTYRDQSSKPEVNLEMTETYVLAQNLRSVYKANDLLPADVKAKAYLYEGHLDLNIKLHPLADHPQFDLDADLQNTNLVKANDFFQAYGNFDVNKGKFGLYSEMAAKDGKFVGYVKPIIKDLDVVGPEDRHDSFLQKLWESIVGAAGIIFRNQKKDQVATKISFEGSFKNPKTNMLDAIVEVIVNAFIRALLPTIDNEINLGSLNSQSADKKSFFQKLFNKDNKEQGKTGKIKSEMKKN